MFDNVGARNLALLQVGAGRDNEGACGVFLASDRDGVRVEKIGVATNESEAGFLITLGIVMAHVGDDALLVGNDSRKIIMDVVRGDFWVA